MSPFPQIHALFRMMSATAATTRKAMATTIEWRKRMAKELLALDKNGFKGAPGFQPHQQDCYCEHDYYRTTVQRTMATRVFDVSLCYPAKLF
jgi:hypothetical protein